MFRHSKFTIPLLWIIMVIPLNAAPRFAGIFGDHLVLQRDKEISVWGNGATPGIKMEIRFDDKSFPVTIEAEGKWQATIPPCPASATGRKLQLLENDTVIATILDVVVGDIWLAAGQSNMQFRVSGMLKGLPETRDWINDSDLPDIRFRRIDDPVLADPKREASDIADRNWVPMDPQSILQFSAVAAVFARDVHFKSKVPVGIIDVSWGGKPIEPFIPRESFLTSHLEKIRTLADENRLAELAALRGGVIIRNPEGFPGAIFNARIAPLNSFPLSGLLWYQAESNAGRGEDPRNYSAKMAALASGWRSRWGDTSLPFYFVQLPSYPPATGWIRVREEQRRALDLIPKSGMVVTIDIPGDNIHPPDKISVGKRLARLVLSGESGPLYQRHEIDESSIRIHFSNTGGALFVGEKKGIAPPHQSSDAELAWFEIAGSDGVWHSATATIDNETVVVTSPKVTNPFAVRYACKTKPQGGNLYNRAGLPASPFCSKLELLPWADQP